MPFYEPTFYKPNEPILSARPFRNIRGNCVSFEASAEYLNLIQSAKDTREPYNTNTSGSRKYLVVYTPNKGLGIVATQSIFPNDFIGEYVGEILTTEEQRKRKELGIGGNKYAFNLPNTSEIVCDAEIRGNFTRLINHSCKPNSRYHFTFADGHFRIVVHAVKDILPVRRNKGSFDNHIHTHSVGCCY